MCELENENNKVCDMEQHSNCNHIYEEQEDEVDVVDGHEIKESPMNIFERENLLKSQKLSKTEDDQLYTEIENMSDEELRNAVQEEQTNIEESDDVKIEAHDHVTVNSLMTNDLNDEELLTLYSLATKIRSDKSYNVVPELPKSIYNNIVSNCKILGVNNPKHINAFARELVQQLAQEIDLDSMTKEFQNELDAALAIPEIVDMHHEHTRDLVEVHMLKAAEEETDPVKKQQLLDIVQAFKDAYTFSRQLKLMEDDSFMLKLPKKIRRFERYCDSFDFTMSKSIVRAPIKMKDLLKELTYILKLSENQCKLFIVLLGETSVNITHENIPGTWFMYHSIKNIYTLARTNNNKTEFSKECVDNLKNLFNVAEQRMASLTSV